METEKLNFGFNVVPIIDELIMELSYIKNGNSPSLEKLGKGVDLIEYLIAYSDKLKGESPDDTFINNLLPEKKSLSTEKYECEENINELEGAKEKIINLMKGEERIDINGIENIQEFLLKISLPFWKEQISIFRPNQFKLIEL